MTMRYAIIINMSKFNRSLIVSILSSIISTMICIYLLLSNIAIKNCQGAGSGFLSCSATFSYPFVLVFILQFFSIRFAGSSAYYFKKRINPYNKKDKPYVVLAISLATISFILFISIACIYYLLKG